MICLDDCLLIGSLSTNSQSGLKGRSIFLPIFFFGAEFYFPFALSRCARA